MVWATVAALGEDLEAEMADTRGRTTLYHRQISGQTAPRAMGLFCP